MKNNNFLVLENHLYFLEQHFIGESKNSFRKKKILQLKIVQIDSEIFILFPLDFLLYFLETKHT